MAPGSTSLPAPALQASDIHKSFGGRPVLRGADLTVAPGQLVAVAGGNGAGKSTLLKILAGALPLDRGRVVLSGSLGYCPQDPVLNAALTVEQHLRYFAAARRLPDIARGRELVRLLGYERYARAAAGVLPGGTRQKLNLTLALLHDPDVLLLDEPCQGLDRETYRRFWDLAQDLRDRGRAVVVTTPVVVEQDPFDLLADLTDGRLVPRGGRRDRAGRPPRADPQPHVRLTGSTGGGGARPRD